MIRRPTSRRWINSIEAHLSQIKRIDKQVDHTNGVALADEIIEAFGQQGRLPAIWPRNEALHPIPPTESRENHSGGRVFTQPGSFTSLWLLRSTVRMSASHPKSDRIAAQQRMTLSGQRSARRKPPEVRFTPHERTLSRHFRVGSFVPLAAVSRCNK